MLQPFSRPEALRAGRLERWALQAEAAEVLGRKSLRACCRQFIAGREELEVFYSKVSGRARYGALQKCDLVWVCPVCQARISEHRRGELVEGVKRWRVEEEQVAVLVTLTFPHGREDDLGELFNRLGKAWKKMTEKRAWKDFRSGFGLAGYVRAWEVTHGEANGWHPHYHVLMFFDRAGFFDEEEYSEWRGAVYNAIYPAWVRACEVAGLPTPSPEHGVDVRDGSYAAKYASKWGLESEMTKGHLKKGREGRSTPRDLLMRSLVDDDMRARELFREFAKASHGRKQLQWSNGLRERLGLGRELQDQEVEVNDATELPVILLTREQWRVVLRASRRQRDARGELLEVLVDAGGDPKAVEELLDDYQQGCVPETQARRGAGKETPRKAASEAGGTGRKGVVSLRQSAAVSDRRAMPVLRREIVVTDAPGYRGNSRVPSDVQLIGVVAG